MNRCIRRARDGDPRATAALVEALRPRISKMAHYYGRRCGEDPDDLLQEAWVGMLEALPEIDFAIGSPEQRLITCAKWRVLDTINRARVRRCAPRENADELFSRSREDALSNACVSEFARRLKKPQREALSLLLSGLTWREAGAALGCSSANIAYHVRQIRRKYEEWSG